MGSTISDNQFMIHFLNNLTTDYDLQLELMEKGVGDSEMPLRIEEIKAELSLCIERLNVGSNQSNENIVLEKHALFSGQYKGKCRNCGQIGHKAAQRKKKHFNHVGNNGNMTERNYCNYCRRTGHVKKDCFKRKKKELQNNNNNRGSNDNSCRDQKFLNPQDMAFVTTSENETLTNEIWICDSGACGHYCNFKEGLMNVKEISDEITFGNGKTMPATKVGDLKFKVIQLDGSSLDVTLYRIKYVPELWMNLFKC
jgi:Zinc knuckle